MRAGHARAVISPERNCPLLGYDQRAEFFPEGGNAGAHDPLFADALVLEDGALRVVIVTLDLCILENPCADWLREEAGAAAGAPPGHVILACSHTHSGPYAWRPGWPCKEPVPGSLRCDASAAYADTLARRLREAAAEASRDLREAEVSARVSALGLAYNRRVPLADGTTGMAWNLREWDGPEPRPAADPAFVCLRVTRRGGSEALLWNTAAHPVVLGKRSNAVSADWPGAARRMIERRRPGLRAMFLHGAGGDAHPWLATGDDPADCETVAQPAAALAGLMTAAPVFGASGGPLAVVSDGRITALRIGPAVLLAAPFELFGVSGERLRAAAGRTPLLLATTANGWEGYLPPAEAFDEGGYEVESARLMGRQPGDCERALERMEALMARL